MSRAALVGHSGVQIASAAVLIALPMLLRLTSRASKNGYAVDWVRECSRFFARVLEWRDCVREWMDLREWRSLVVFWWERGVDVGCVVVRWTLRASFVVTDWRVEGFGRSGDDMGLTLFVISVRTGEDFIPRLYVETSFSFPPCSFLDAR